MLKFKKVFAVLCSMLIFNITCTYAEENNILVKLDGNYVEFETVKPVIKDSRTLIPLRGLFENMGYTIDWEPNLKAAILSKSGNTISIRSNKKYITVNNIQTKIDVPAQIINGSMMIPLRAVADATGSQVNWDSATKTAEIITSDRISYIVDINDYTKAYNELIKPLEILDSVAAGLNSLNSNKSEENIENVISQLQNAKSVITSVKDDVSKLEPNENFKDMHNLSLEAMDKQLELCDVLILAVSDKIDYAKAKVEIEELLSEAKNLNSQMDKISFDFD